MLSNENHTYVVGLDRGKKKEKEKTAVLFSATAQRQYRYSLSQKGAQGTAKERPGSGGTRVTLSMNDKNLAEFREVASH